MRIEVYDGDTLAATFSYGQRPRYYGDAGRRVRALVDGPHQVHNLWTGECSTRPGSRRVDWWAANIFSAGLREAGFQVRVSMPVTLEHATPPPPRPWPRCRPVVS